jgi:alanine dehydrogenase
VADLSLGVIARSRKQNEWRLPIHPLHVGRIEADLRARIYLEHGYGERFGVPDDQLAPLVGGMRSRGQLIRDCDVILLAKPLSEDLAELRVRQTVWGWVHCVQNEALTQSAVDRRLTVIALEEMTHSGTNGGYALNVFHRNRELAGYCSVLHALAVIGTTGHYGRQLRAAVISFGATARGAITALNAQGVHDVDVLTARNVTDVGSPIHSARLVHFVHQGGRCHIVSDGETLPIAVFLSEHDIIVNCVRQDTDAPLTFLVEEDLARFAAGTLIIDVSCDQGMGFSWARPTTFSAPTIVVGGKVHYYAVDHSPSYLWNSATWDISEALLPYLRAVLDGRSEVDETIRRAIEIRRGRIQNPKILSFQRRSPDYPHARDVLHPDRSELPDERSSTYQDHIACPRNTLSAAAHGADVVADAGVVNGEGVQ